MYFVANWIFDGEGAHCKNKCVVLTRVRMSFDCPKNNTPYTCVTAKVC